MWCNKICLLSFLFLLSIRYLFLLWRISLHLTWRIYVRLNFCFFSVEYLFVQLSVPKLSDMQIFIITSFQYTYETKKLTWPVFFSHFLWPLLAIFFTITIFCLEYWFSVSVQYTYEVTYNSKLYQCLVSFFKLQRSDKKMSCGKKSQDVRRNGMKIKI